MIYLDEEHKIIIRDILKDYPYPVYVYGSRSKGNHRQNSDLDVCIIDERVTFDEILNLQIAFEDSYLPFTVDVVAWKNLSAAFQELIKPDLQLFN